MLAVIISRAAPEIKHIDFSIEIWYLKQNVSCIKMFLYRKAFIFSGFVFTFLLQFPKKSSAVLKSTSSMEQKFNENTSVCSHLKQPVTVSISYIRALEQQLVLAQQCLDKETVPSLRRKLGLAIQILQFKLKNAKNNVCLHCIKEKKQVQISIIPVDIKGKNVSIEVSPPEKEWNELYLTPSIDKLQMLEKIDWLIRSSKIKIKKIKNKLNIVNKKIQFLELSPSKKKIQKLQEEAHCLRLELEEANRILKTYNERERP